MKDACKYFHIYKWREPPSEPDEDGTLHEERQCLKLGSNNRSECFYDGNLELCDIDNPLDDNDFFNHI